MTQIINHLIAMIGLLALLHVGSITLWRSMKQAIKPTPKEFVLRSTVLTVVAGGTACIIMLIAACSIWKITSACLS